MLPSLAKMIASTISLPPGSWYCILNCVGESMLVRISSSERSPRLPRCFWCLSTFSRSAICLVMALVVIGCGPGYVAVDLGQLLLHGISNVANHVHRGLRMRLQVLHQLRRAVRQLICDCLLEGSDLALQQHHPLRICRLGRR